MKTPPTSQKESDEVSKMIKRRKKVRLIAFVACNFLFLALITLFVIIFGKDGGFASFSQTTINNNDDVPVFDDSAIPEQSTSSTGTEKPVSLPIVAFDGKQEFELTPLDDIKRCDPSEAKEFKDDRAPSVMVKRCK